MGATLHINATTGAQDRKHYCFTVRKSASICSFFRKTLSEEEKNPLPPPRHVHLLLSEAEALVIENPVRQCPSLALTENWSVSVHHFPIKPSVSVVIFFDPLLVTLRGALSPSFDQSLASTVSSPVSLNYDPRDKCSCFAHNGATDRRTVL